MDIEDAVSKRVARGQIEDREKWREWGEEAPWLQFPPELEVKVVPPFGGAMARFRARFVGGEREVSVYWDVTDALGFEGEPYWEIYPVKYKGFETSEDYTDTARFLQGQEPEMMVAIIKSLMGEYQE